MQSTMIEYQKIIEAIQTWPLDQRIRLMQDILHTVVPELQADQIGSPSKKNTLNDALGLLTTSRAAPSDEEIQRWLEEHRIEKYG